MSAWRSVALGEVATVERLTVQPSQIKAGTFYVGLEHIESGGRLLAAKSVDAGELASSKFCFTGSHILYGKLRPYLAKIACPNFSGVCSTDILPIMPGPEIDRRYLFHFLLQPTMVAYASACAVGANLPRLSPAVLCDFKIPLPPLAEQVQIAKVLDMAEALRDNRRAALALNDSLAQSIFINDFGDPTVVLSKWPCKTLGEMLDFITSGSRGWSAYYAESGDLFLRIQNVRRDELVLADNAYVNAPDVAEAKRTRVRAGDVLLSITADLGRTAVIPDDLGPAYINQHLSILRTKSMVPRFLSAYLASPAGQLQVFRRNRQAVKAGLNFDDIRSFVVPTPPIKLQSDFARKADVVDRIKAVHRESLAKLDTLFAALQCQAFQGGF